MHEIDREWILSQLNSTEPCESKLTRTFLDIGCSDGLFLKGFNLGGGIWGIEPNISQQKIARTNGVQIVNNIADVPNLDTVILRGVLHHLPDYEDIIAQICTVFSNSNSSNKKYLFLIANPNAESLVFKKFGRLPALEFGASFASVYKVHGAKSTLLELESKGFSGYLQYPYLNTPYSHPVRDFSLVLKSFMTGRYISSPFPRNMFNLVAKFDA